MANHFIKKAVKVVLIICNIVFSVSLILACYGSRLNNGNYWIFGLINLAVLYFLLFDLFFIIFWLFVKPWLTLIGLISILICWSPIQNLFQFRFDVSFEHKKTRGVLRVMSWNVEHFDILEHKTHPEKKQEMFDLINEYDPDIACFQEMVASDSVSNAINYIPDFKKKIKMLDYHFSFNKTLDFDRKHHFGIVIFSKYPIINKVTFIPEPHCYNSIFQFIDIVRNNDTFRVFNLHLQSLKFSPENRDYLNEPSIKNEEDIKETKTIISKFKTGFFKHHWQSDNVKREIDNSPYPVIICGDFNDVPNSYAYNTIGEGLNNAFTIKGSAIGNTYDGISPTLRIDNIFLDEKFSVEQFIRIKKKLSDHFPIVSDFIFHKQ